MSKTNFCKAAPKDMVCVDERMDVAFFVDPIQFSDPETGDYFKMAKEFYTQNFPSMPQKDVQSLDEIIKALNADPHGPVAWGEVHIVAHGAEKAWYVKGRFLDSQYKQRLIDLITLREIQRGRIGVEFAKLDTVKTKDPNDSSKEVEWTKPDLVDPATKIIINSCEVGKKSAHMLDVISDLFRGWPEVYGPQFWVFFRKDTSGTVVRRFFRDSRSVVLSARDAALPLAPAAQKKVVKQLLKQHPGADESRLTALVKRVQNEWSGKVQADEWIKKSPFNHEFARLLVVDESGALVNRQEAKTKRDEDGYIEHVPKEDITLTTVKDADLSSPNPKVRNQKGLDALDELFRRFMKGANFADDISIRDFGPGAVDVKTNPAVEGGAPRHHIVRVMLDAVILNYFQIVKNKAGDAPVDPDHNKPGHYVASTFQSRCGQQDGQRPSDYYRVDKYNDKKTVDDALTVYENWKNQRDFEDAFDTFFLR
jgi:hypothetical protein